MHSERCWKGLGSLLPQVHNRYHKTAPSGAVYVGRPSPWGNPFDTGTREEKVENYRKWIMEWEQTGLRQRIRDELRGKDLICFCKPKPCHADMLLVIAHTEDGFSMGWNQWDGPGTEGYCRSIPSISIPDGMPEEDVQQLLELFYD